MIRILGDRANERGDLFGRLIKDMFLALGYDDRVRLNIHKSGREIDLETFHRTESRRVIAECKATATPSGGDAVNKFVGSLDAERRKYPDKQTIGYFVSLSGFTETALEQEAEVGGNRVVLIDGPQIVNQLVKGHIIASPLTALDRAGRCVPSDVESLLIAETDCDLLAHPLGWIWVVYYGNNKKRTHFALIHADGEPLAESIAEMVVTSDRSLAKHLSSLQYVSPPLRNLVEGPTLVEVRNRYFKYLANECGEIQLEGLPADSDVGSRRLNLENLFVPLKVVPQPTADREKLDPIGLGRALGDNARLAILAAPGGGKSTLIKRLAISYAFPERRALLNDGLPDRAWLPLLIKCRQLGKQVRDPITQVLHSLAERSELTDCGPVFRTMVDDALRKGEVLLLVDGLDEISDDSSRVGFVTQLRTFLATYPTTNIVVTSREAGFRVVGGSLASYCEHYTLADFDDGDIAQLTKSWHREVVGDRPEVAIEAAKLAQSICETDRVRRLAKNPLLLTTLLLVKRWVGHLPTRRSVLYGKAIEVLLMTWNVEGHEPLDQEEVVPQLAFVAFQMMKDGVQTISAKRLRELLTQARKQMPDILAYPRFSVNDFVDRVELRSSLLMLNGYDVEDGSLYAMYEFRHLTFQEYLTAKAIAEGFYPNRKESDTLLDVIQPFILEEHWKEVVPLTAVLAGRKAQPLVQHLIDLLSAEMTADYQPERDPSLRPTSYHLLGQCLLDDILVPPHIAREALDLIAQNQNGSGNFVPALARGRYKDVFREVVEAGFASFAFHPVSYACSLAELSIQRVIPDFSSEMSLDVYGAVLRLLDSAGPIEVASGALAVAQLAFKAFNSELKNQGEFLEQLGDRLVPLLFIDDHRLQFSASWAFCWLATTGHWSPERNPEILSSLATLWVEGHLPDYSRQPAWAITNLPLIDRSMVSGVDLTPTVSEFLIGKSQGLDVQFPSEFNVPASLITAYYFGGPWSDTELINRCHEFVKSFKNHQSKDRLIALAEKISHSVESGPKKEIASSNESNS